MDFEKSIALVNFINIHYEYLPFRMFGSFIDLGNAGISSAGIPEPA